MVCFYWIKKVLYMLLLNEGIFYGINCLIFLRKNDFYLIYNTIFRSGSVMFLNILSSKQDGT